MSIFFSPHYGCISRKIPKNQHNLNIWTFDQAIIGTSLGHWARPDNGDEDNDISDFVLGNKQKEENILVKLGDFDVFTKFLQRIIGSPVESHNA